MVRPLGASNFSPHWHPTALRALASSVLRTPMVLRDPLDLVSGADLVTAVLLVHALWCVWVLLGWMVTRGRPVARTLHIVSLAYAIVIESVPWPPCPLTVAET